MRAARSTGRMVTMGNDGFESMREVADRMFCRYRQGATVGARNGADFADFAGHVTVQVDRVGGTRDCRTQHQTGKQQRQPAPCAARATCSRQGRHAFTRRSMRQSSIVFCCAASRKHRRQFGGGCLIGPSPANQATVTARR